MYYGITPAGDRKKFVERGTKRCNCPVVLDRKSGSWTVSWEMGSAVCSYAVSLKCKCRLPRLKMTVDSGEMPYHASVLNILNRGKSGYVKLAVEVEDLKFSNCSSDITYKVFYSSDHFVVIEMKGNKTVRRSQISEEEYKELKE